MLVVAFFVFSLLNLTPGDPVILLAGEDATAQDIARIRASLSLDQPFFFRFAQWLWRVVQGDLGESIFTGLSVSHMIGQHLTPTITLMLMTLVSSMLIAIPLGALAAWFRNGAFDRLVVMLTVVSFSIPSFVIGYLIAWIVGIKFGLLPVQGYIPFSEGFWLIKYHPSIAIGTATLTLLCIIALLAPWLGTIDPTAISPALRARPPNAHLSFIGAGVPPSTPSWGNIMAEGRTLWQIKPYLIAFPALFLSFTILSLNMLGDGLRDAIDPRLAKRI
eukprot:gene8299-8383_t